jgi:hypothetical protein
VGEDEGSCREPSRNGMPQVKGVKELIKLPVGSKEFVRQAKQPWPEKFSGYWPLPCLVLSGEGEF